MEIGPAIVSVFLIALFVGQTQVYGNYVENLARRCECKAVASQSSTYSSGGRTASASLAIDGNPDPDFFNSYSCSHTAGGDNTPFWLLNLGKTTKMSRVHIYNRKDRGTGARFTDIEIKVYKYNENVYDDTQGTVVATYDKQNPVEDFIKIKFNAPIYGMWLKIGFKTKNKAGRYIHLCEVEVYNCDD